MRTRVLVIRFRKEFNSGRNSIQLAACEPVGSFNEEVNSGAFVLKCMYVSVLICTLVQLYSNIIFDEGYTVFVSDYLAF